MGQLDNEAKGLRMLVSDRSSGGLQGDLALAAIARKIYESRQDRNKKSPIPGLFQDPAWDILLDLFISQTENKNISVMSAGLAGHTAQSTALRWLWALEDAKLVERKHDKSDKRRSFVSLAPLGLSYMREVLAQIGDRFR